MMRHAALGCGFEFLPGGCFFSMLTTYIGAGQARLWYAWLAQACFGEASEEILHPISTNLTMMSQPSVSFRLETSRNFQLTMISLISVRDIIEFYCMLNCAIILPSLIVFIFMVIYYLASIQVGYCFGRVSPFILHVIKKTQYQFATNQNCHLAFLNHTPINIQHFYF